MTNVTVLPRYKRRRVGDHGTYHIKWEEVEAVIEALPLSQVPEEIVPGDTLLQGFFQLPFTMDLSSSIITEESRADMVACVGFMSPEGLLKLIPLKKLLPYLECFEERK